MRFGRKEGREDPLPDPQIAARTVGHVATDGSLVFDDGRIYVRGETTITETGMAMTQYDPLPGVEVVPPDDVEVVAEADRTGATFDPSNLSYRLTRDGEIAVNVQKTRPPVARRGLDLTVPSEVLDSARRAFQNGQLGIVDTTTTDDRLHVQRRPGLAHDSFAAPVAESTDFVELQDALRLELDKRAGIIDINLSGEA